MTGDDWLRIITIVLSSIGLWLSSWIAYRQTRDKLELRGLHQKSDIIQEKSTIIEDKVDFIHKDMNSKLTELVNAKVAEALSTLKLRTSEALSQGRQEGIEQERTRNEDPKLKAQETVSQLSQTKKAR